MHDWLTGWRGGEKVLLELVRMFPRARIATLVHVPGATHPQIDARVARTSFLQKIPGIARYYRHYLPLFPRAVRSLRLDGDCDLVVSVSHAVAKGVVPPVKDGRHVPHICYCNTPMRYIWGMEDQYLSRASPRRAALKLVTPALRRFDRRNEHVSLFLANSRNVADRIERFYRRQARVVYAGIDHDYYHLPQGPPQREDFYLAVSALVGYKRIDLAVKTFLNLPDRRLIVIGAGPEAARLRALARDAPQVVFLGRQPDEVLRDHYQRCRAFVFPGEEDFGLTPVEAQACGAPVIAFRSGGALETVMDAPPPPLKATGIFFDQQTEASLADAVRRFEAAPPFDPQAQRQSALRFTWGSFRAGIARAIEDVMTSSGILPGARVGS